MSAIARGARNAVRSPGRTLAVTVILGLSLALALSMAVAKQAVDDRVTAAEANIGNVLDGLATTLVVRPAGAFGGGFGGPGGAGGQQATLDETVVATLQGLDHVAEVVSALTTQVQSSDTSLQSAITFQGGPGGPGGGGRGTFTPPITAIGATSLDALSTLGTGTLTVTSGSLPDLGGTGDEAVLGTELAAHNGLALGSTFTLQGQDITVVGLTSSAGGNRFANNSLVLPLATLQGLTNRSGEISTAIIHVDAAANLEAVQASATSAVGAEADIVNLQEQTAQSNALADAESTVSSLKGVSGLALTSLIGALVAAIVIVFLTMTMVVRERRREIGVLKTLGAPTGKIVAQYATEALVLTGLALILGLGFAFLFGNTVTHALVSSNSASGTQGPTGPGGGFQGPGNNGLFGVSTAGIEADLSLFVIVLGFTAAFAVALLGSVMPTLAIARVRPSEVLRGD